MLNEHSNKSVDTKPITNQEQKMRDFEILSPEWNVGIFPFFSRLRQHATEDGAGWRLAKATKEG